MPIKIHLPPDSAIRSTNSSSRSRLALIWPTQESCAPAAMMSRSNALVRFTLMAKLSSTKKTAILPCVRSARAFSRSISSTMLWFERKRIGVAEEPGHGAEFAAVGAAAPGLDGNDVEGLPVPFEVAHDRPKSVGNPVELVEIERLPRYVGIIRESRLALLPECIHGRIDLFQCAARRVFHNAAARSHRPRPEPRHRRDAGRHPGRALRRGPRSRGGRP